MEILFDKSLTLDTLTKRAETTSWSEYKSFSACRSGWFASNVAKSEVDPKTKAATVTNDNESTSGWIIQRLYQALINEKVYARPDLTEAEQLNYWIAKSVEQIYDLIVFPLESQFDPMFTSTFLGHFFSKNANGKLRLERALRDRQIDPVFSKGLAPRFVDPEFVEVTFGGASAFKNHIAKIAINALPAFVRHHPPQETVSEIFFQAKLPSGVTVQGGVDFIRNPTGTPLDFRLKTLAHGYSISDGKFKVHAKYTDPNQLNWYLAAIRLMTRKDPSNRHGLFDWTSGQYHPVEYNPGFLSTMLKYGDDRTVVFNQLKESISRNPSQSQDLYGLGLEFNPSKSNCKFCQLRGLCQARKDAGISESDTFVSRSEFTSVERFDSSLKVVTL